MHIEQIWTGNTGRNFNYLAVCGKTGAALAIDPLDWEKCLAVARRKGWKISAIVNTHEHGDHIGGNARMMEETGAPLYIPKGGAARIPGAARELGAGDTVAVGDEILDVLYTPGHTMLHISLVSREAAPAFLCGDTMFNAGVGNCHNGGHPEVLYRTYSDQVTRMPVGTRIYPGHHYIANNLRFTLDREPDNARAASLLEEVKDENPEKPLVTTLALEREINTFLRLSQPTVKARIRASFPDVPADPDEKTVFLKLRELRNKW